MAERVSYCRRQPRLNRGKSLSCCCCDIRFESPEVSVGIQTYCGPMGVANSSDAVCFLSLHPSHFVLAVQWLAALADLGPPPNRI